MLPNYASAKDKLNAPDFDEGDTFMQLCKHLLETAEACEVGKNICYGCWTLLIFCLTFNLN